MNRAANTCADIVIVILVIVIVIVRSSPYCRIRGSMSAEESCWKRENINCDDNVDLNLTTVAS